MIEKFARFFKLSNFNIWRRNNTNWWPRSWPAQFPTFEASWQRRRRRQQGITEHEVSRAAGRGTTPLMLLLLLRLFRQLGEHPHTKHCNTTKLLRLPGINEFLIWRKQLESLRLTLAMLVFKVSNSKGFDAVSQRFKITLKWDILRGFRRMYLPAIVRMMFNDLCDIWITCYYDAQCNLSQCQVVCGDRWVNLSTWSCWNSRFGLNKKLAGKFRIFSFFIVPISHAFGQKLLILNSAEGIEGL